jgi:transposase-like protein
MADLAYREVYAMTRDQARLRMVMTYAETRSVSETARRWGTSRQVVRRWLTRFQAEGLSGLSDLPTYGEYRIQRRQRILEYHPYPGSAYLTHPLSPDGQ